MARQLNVLQRHLLLRLLGPRGMVVLPTAASVNAAAEPRVPAPRTGSPEPGADSSEPGADSAEPSGERSSTTGGAAAGGVPDPAAEDRRRARLEGDGAAAVRLAAEVARGMHRGFPRH